METEHAFSLPLTEGARRAMRNFGDELTPAVCKRAEELAHHRGDQYEKGTRTPKLGGGDFEQYEVRRKDIEQAVAEGRGISFATRKKK